MKIKIKGGGYVESCVEPYCRKNHCNLCGVCLPEGMAECSFCSPLSLQEREPIAEAVSEFWEQHPEGKASR